MIDEVPEDTAVTTPLVSPMAATDGLLLVQVPPGVASLKVVLLHIAVVPVIGVSGLTVTVTVAIQPLSVV